MKKGFKIEEKVLIETKKYERYEEKNYHILRADLILKKGGKEEYLGEYFISEIEKG